MNSTTARQAWPLFPMEYPPALLRVLWPCHAHRKNWDLWAYRPCPQRPHGSEYSGATPWIDTASEWTTACPELRSQEPVPGPTHSLYVEIMRRWGKPGCHGNPNMSPGGCPGRCCHHLQPLGSSHHDWHLAGRAQHKGPFKVPVTPVYSCKMKYRSSRETGLQVLD